MKRLAVFCGSNAGNAPAFRESCEQLADVLIAAHIEVVYGGGNVGLMGSIADAMLARGGLVTGVIPERLVEKEVAHQGLTELIIVKTMHERKATMAELSDGFLALPGGIGTLEEIMEVFTWTQLGYHAKPCALLNVNGYYDHLHAFLNRMVESKFLREEFMSLLLISSDVKQLIDHMQNTRIVYQDKWLRDKI